MYLRTRDRGLTNRIIGKKENEVKQKTGPSFRKNNTLTKTPDSATHTVQRGLGLGKG